MVRARPRWHAGSVSRRRILTAAAAVWVAGYLVVYLVIISRQGDGPPAWWYVGLLVLLVGLLAGAAIGDPGHGVLMGTVVLLGFATLIAMLSIGIFLAPALAAAGGAAALSRPAAPST